MNYKNKVGVSIYTKGKEYITTKINSHVRPDGMVASLPTIDVEAISEDGDIVKVADVQYCEMFGGRGLLYLNTGIKVTTQAKLMMLTL